MPENNVSAPVKTVTRNGVTLTSVTAVFGKRSPNVGKAFPNFEIPQPRLETLLVVDKKEDGSFTEPTPTQALIDISGVLWIGVQDMIKSANKAVRTIMGKIFTDVIDDDTGEVDWEAWAEAAPDFSAARVTLQDLDDDIEDKQALMSSLLEKIEATTEGALVSENDMHFMAQMKQLGNEVKALKAEKASVEVVYKARAEKRKITKAANEAKKKALAAQVAVPA